MVKSDNSKVVAIIQARGKSSRLPGKILADVHGMPLLQFILQRVRRATKLDAVMVATSDQPADDPIAELCRKLDVSCYRGDETDVLARYRDAAVSVGADIIVRITGDCPFADPEIIDVAIMGFHADGFDYFSNVMQRTYPDGLDVEVFSRATLDRTAREATLPAQREHVTPFMRTGAFSHLPDGGFRVGHLTNPVDFSHLRWTVDYPDDLAFVRAVVPRLKEPFSWLDLIALLTRDAELLQYNRQHRARRPASALGTTPAVPNQRKFDASNATLDRALRMIPLGSQTFSKSHQQWVRGAGPRFAERAQGCRFTDVDGNEYIDYLLALLPVVLGYCDPAVDAAIVAQLEKGIVFSLPHRVEMELAERLVRLIPCAEMVRFGKNGSDVTTAAVRLARAHTGRAKVAICGYHGWHDWYIGTTPRDLGVPEAVKALSATFPYNDADALEKLLTREPKAYAAVILEPAGAQAPAPGFLERLRALTEKFGVVLIFDEIITGFRLHMGGAQAHYGVLPDLACFGKSMANGMPISALVGPRRIMHQLEDIFFSATFGGEALSIVAAIATIDKLERKKVIPALWRRGEELRDGANALFAKRGLGEFVAFTGEGWWPRIKMTKPPVDATLLTSLLRQELNANGLLLGASFNLCLAHDDDAVVTETLAAIDNSAVTVRQALDSKNPATHLRGELVRPTFSVR